MTLHIELDLDPTVNFAMQQNDVPVVKALRLSNEGTDELRELVVRVWGEPTFMVPWSGRVAAIAPGGTYNLELPEIELSAAFLLELIERLVGAVHTEVIRDGQTLGQLRKRIEVLAREQWITHGRQRDHLRQQLYVRYTVHLLQLDLDALQRRLEEASQTFWPLAWLKRLGVYRRFKQVSQPGHKPAQASLGEDLRLARTLRHTENALSAAGDRARHVLGQLWSDGAADWDALARLQTWGTAFRQLTHQAGGTDVQQTAQCRHTLAQLLTEGRALVQPEGQIGRALAHYCQTFDQCNAAKQRLEALLSLHAEAAWGTPGEADAMARMRQHLGEWRAALPGLQSWCHWRAARRDAARLGLEPLVLVYEREGLATAELMRTFERGFYHLSKTWRTCRETSATSSCFRSAMALTPAAASP